MQAGTTTHFVIPDTQIKPGVPLEHIKWLSEYAVDKLPDAIILIGDWADMESLSSYEIGKKSFEGRSYKNDIDVANDALSTFMAPIHTEMARRAKGKRARWNPTLIITLGNHEYRIDRAIDSDRKLEGLISTDDLKFKDFGFEVIPFLQPVIVDGIAYCHYFSSGVMGRPVGTARALLTKYHMSCIAGHQQGRDIAFSKRADGTRITAIIAGSCYLHDELYLNPQTNDVWKGMHVLHEVKNGAFDEMPVSLTYLRERYARN